MKYYLCHDTISVQAGCQLRWPIRCLVKSSSFANEFPYVIVKDIGRFQFGSQQQLPPQRGNVGRGNWGFQHLETDKDRVLNSFNFSRLLNDSLRGCVCISKERSSYQRVGDANFWGWCEISKNGDFWALMPLSCHDTASACLYTASAHSYFCLYPPISD